MFGSKSSEINVLGLILRYVVLAGCWPAAKLLLATKLLGCSLRDLHAMQANSLSLSVQLSKLFDLMIRWSCVSKLPNVVKDFAVVDHIEFEFYMKSPSRKRLDRRHDGKHLTATSKLQFKKPLL